MDVLIRMCNYVIKMSHHYFSMACDLEKKTQKSLEKEQKLALNKRREQLFAKIIIKDVAFRRLFILLIFQLIGTKGVLISTYN